MCGFANPILGILLADGIAIATVIGFGFGFGFVFGFIAGFGIGIGIGFGFGFDFGFGIDVWCCLCLYACFIPFGVFFVFFLFFLFVPVSKFDLTRVSADNKFPVPDSDSRNFECCSGDPDTFHLSAPLPLVEN